MGIEMIEQCADTDNRLPGAEFQSCQFVLVSLLPDFGNKRVDLVCQGSRTMEFASRVEPGNVKICNCMNAVRALNGEKL
jgi:hypothetical protein